MYLVSEGNGWQVGEALEAVVSLACARWQWLTEGTVAPRVMASSCHRLMNCAMASRCLLLFTSSHLQTNRPRESQYGWWNYFPFTLSVFFFFCGLYNIIWYSLSVTLTQNKSWKHKYFPELHPSHFCKYFIISFHGTTLKKWHFDTM